MGTDVLGEDFYYAAGNLLLFTQNGEIVRAVSVVPAIVDGRGGPGSSSRVRVVPFSEEAPSSLRLVEPG